MLLDEEATGLEGQRMAIMMRIVTSGLRRKRLEESLWETAKKLALNHRLTVSHQWRLSTKMKLSMPLRNLNAWHRNSPFPQVKHPETPVLPVCFCVLRSVVMVITSKM